MKKRLLEDGYRVTEVPSHVVEKNWGYFGNLIIASLPPQGEIEDEFLAGNLLKAIQTKRLTVWALGLVKGDDRDYNIVAVLTTYNSIDQITGLKTLTMYTFTPDAPDFSKHRNGLRVLKEFLQNYAKNTGCRKVIAFTKDDGYKKLAEAVGFTSSYTLVQEV